MKFCTNCGKPVEKEVVAEPIVPVSVEEPISAPVCEPVIEAQTVEHEPISVAVEEPVAEPTPEVVAEPAAKPAPVVTEFCAPLVEQPAATKPPKKKKTGRTVGSVLLSILLTLLMIVFAVYASVALSVRHLVSQSSLTELIGDVKFADIRMNYFVGGDEDIKLPEYIHGELSAQIASNVSVRNMKKLVDAAFVKEFFAELLYGYVADIFGEEGRGIISIDRVEEFLEENYREINDVLDYDIEYSDYEYLVEYLDEELELEENSDFAGVRESDGELLSYIAIAGSYIVLYICAGLCILYALLILIVNRGRAGSWVTVGISSLLLGGVYFAGAFALPVLRKPLEESNELGSNLIEAIFNFVRDHLMMVGVCCVGVFALMIVIAIIVNAVCKAKARKAACAV